MASLKQLMTILSYNKISDEERAQLVSGFTQGRTTSARELTPSEISEIVVAFQKVTNDSDDKWRKSLIASIYGFLSKMNKKGSMELVKGIACRAAGVRDFNKIPKQRLISLYYAFTNAQKDLNFAKNMIREFIIDSQNYN